MLNLHELHPVSCFLVWLVWVQNACAQHCCVCGCEFQCVHTKGMGLWGPHAVGAQDVSVFLLGPQSVQGQLGAGKRLFIQWDQLHQRHPPQSRMEKWQGLWSAWGSPAPTSGSSSLTSLGVFRLCWCNLPLNNVSQCQLLTIFFGLFWVPQISV